jgi:hypothetical protein
MELVEAFTPHSVWEQLVSLPGPAGVFPVIGLALAYGYIKLAQFGWNKRAEVLGEQRAQEAAVRERHRRAYLERLGLDPDAQPVVDPGDRPSAIADAGRC